MKKKIIAFALAIVSVLCLSGCGGFFDREYVYIADYTPPAQTEQTEDNKISVRNINELKRELIGFVEDGIRGGTLVFDTAYDGDASQDMQKAVWEIRTRNAICAYCVESINYELSKIVTYYEAVVRITYSESYPVSEIVRLSYAIDVDRLIENALENNREKLVIYIASSTLSTDKIKSSVSQVYRRSPLICAAEPNVTVNMYSGTLNQRLYEINFSYGLSEQELIDRKSKVIEPDYLNELDIDGSDTYDLLLAGCTYLTENCKCSSDSSRNSAYDAFLDFSADSKGLALAYVELCNRMGCSCTVVEGQKDRVRHFWNIVEIDGNNYHVDISACIEEGMDKGFLLNDEGMWGSYRWDLSSTPRCEDPVLYVPKNTETVQYEAETSEETSLEEAEESFENEDDTRANINA